MCEIIGQFHVKRLLTNIIKSGRIPHAYLFVGPEGTGKMKAAIFFSKALNCDNVREGEACNECISCRKVDSGNHPDISIIEPQGTSTKIDQMREMIKEASFRSYESPWKIFIISRAETASLEAANSILKVLEEPPERTMFILLSTSIELLPSTIVSRCQVIEFRRVPEEAIEGYITEKAGIPRHMARPFAWLSNGAPDKALELATSEEVKALRNRVIQEIARIPACSKLEILEIASDFAKDKDNVNLVVDILTSWFRDILILIETRSKDFIVNIDKVDLLERVVKSFSKSRIFWIINELQDLKRTIWLTRKSLNIQLAFEVLLLNIFGEMDYVQGSGRSV